MTRTELVSVPTLAYKPLPPALTDPLPLPPRPAAACTAANGQPAVCVLDALGALPVLQALVQACNADRATAAYLGATDGQ